MVAVARPDGDGETYRFSIDKKDAIASMGCGMVVATLVLAPFAIYWQGWVFAKVWGWLIVPAFGAKPLSVGAAVCGLIVLRIAQGLPGNRDKTDKGERSIQVFGRLLAKMFVAPAISLAVGYLLLMAIRGGYLPL